MTLKVSFDDLENKGTDSGGGIILYYQGRPFTGIIEEFSNGILIGESEFTNGHLGGVQREYYPSGTIKEEYFIHFNKVEGSFKEWDENGNLINETFWKNGEQIQ